MEKYYIRLTNVDKTFPNSRVSAIRSISGRLTGNEDYAQNEIIRALSDISLTIQNGEKVGIIGHNGAGKTTLLNLIAGLSEPTAGTVDVSGRVNAIMTLGVGLREEMTGIDNIYVAGELHGKTHDEVSAQLQEIIDFADIGEYIGRPVKTYSSGMKARLSFACLSFISPEILVIDEVLGVGDAAFAVKSAKKISDLCSQGKILIVVSHNMSTIMNLTDRTILMDQGRIIMDGPSNIVTERYLAMVHKQLEEELRREFEQRLETPQGSGAVLIKDLRMKNASGTPQSVFNLYDPASIELTLEAIDPSIIDAWDIRFSFIKMDGTLLMQNSAASDGFELPMLVPGKEIGIQVDLGRLNIAEGVYEILSEIVDSQGVVASKTTIMKMQNTREFPLSKPEYYCQYDIDMR